MGRGASAPRSGITVRDLLNEALAGIFARPGRMVLTVLGVVIGMSALVATVGLTRTAGNRIISQFDQLAATELFVTARPGATTGIVDPKALPWDAPARLRRLNGVVAAGTVSDVDVGNALVSSSPVKDPLNQSALRLAVRAGSPDMFRAVRAVLETGRLPDAGHSDRADRVAVLGPDAAQRLGIHGVERLPAISIGDQIYLVIGILSDTTRRPELLGSVIIPEGTARRYFGLAGPGMVIIETRIGAAYLIAEQARPALRPDDPRALRVQVPQEPKRVRDEVQTDLNVMFLLLGGLSLIVGALGIANITLVGVMERTGEIGLRRAIGATRGHIAMQFLLESASMGLVGGIDRRQHRRPDRGGRLRLPGLEPSAGSSGTLARACGRRRDRLAVGPLSGFPRGAPGTRRSIPALIANRQESGMEQACLPPTRCSNRGIAVAMWPPGRTATWGISSQWPRQ